MRQGMGAAAMPTSTITMSKTTATKVSAAHAISRGVGMRKNTKASTRPDGHAIERTLDDQGGHRGPEGLAPPRHHVDPQNLAGAEGQDVVAHVADHHRVEEMGGMRVAGKQETPADGARPEGGEADDDAHGEPAPVRVGEPREHRAHVHLPEEPHEEARR